MKYVLLIPLLAFLTACAAKQNKSSQPQPKQERNNPQSSVEHRDPASAPLYPARKIAPASDFEVALLSGQPFRLSEQKGKVVLMNIWATWCPPCREETPELVELYNEYKDRGFVILGVSVDEQGISVVRPFMEEFNVNYPMYIDEDETIIKKYGPLMGIPTTYIIDKKGNLRYFAVGALTKKELEPKIRDLLAEES